MTRDKFKYLTKDNIVFLDGATGSHLLAAGMPNNVCIEQWICENPQVLLNLQKSYIAAGSDIIYASTFGANRMRLNGHGMGDEIRRLNETPVKIARQAAGPELFVAGDVSMSGAQLTLFEEEFYEPLVENYKEQIGILAEAGCDCIIIETMLNLREAQAAVVAARAVCDLPVLVTVSFEANCRTFYGDKPEDCAKVLEDSGADAVGANCSTGPEKMLPVIEAMAKVTRLPLIAKPNAGLPQPGPNGTVQYDMSADAFAVHMTRLIEAGANLVGGCCGTNPEYISKLVSLAGNMNFKTKE